MLVSTYTPAFLCIRQRIAFKVSRVQGIVVHTSNISSQEAEAEGFQTTKLD
jgi:hypothetical protein